MSRCSWLLLPLLFLFACEKEKAPEGPAQVMLNFLQTMRQVHGDAAEGERALQMMWKPARDNLRERARRASALSGRELGEGEMIAPSWFALRIVPEKAEERVDGEWAEVTLTAHGGQQAVARCVLEDDKWKVALELPPLAPIRSRSASD